MKPLVAAIFLAWVGIGAVECGADENSVFLVAQGPEESMPGMPGAPAATAGTGVGAQEAPPGPPAVGTEAPAEGQEGPPQPPAAPERSPERPHGEVVNGGFEKGLEAWQTAPGAQATVEADAAAARSGKSSARLSVRRADVAAWLAQDIPLAGTAGRLEVSYWVRPTLGGPARLVARLDFLDAGGGKVMTRYLQHVGRDAKKWQQATGVVELPAAARMLRLTLRLVGAGGAWVDDVAVKFLPAALLVWPRRVACVEGQACGIEFDFWAKPNGALVATMDGQKEIVVSADGGKARVELPPLSVGRHLVTLTAGEAKDEVEIWCVPAGRRARMVSETGLWVLKQRQCLVSLMHHASVPDLAELTAHGFSVAEILAPESPDGLSRALRPLPKQSTPVLVSFPAPGPGAEEDWQGRVLQAIRANAADQRIAGWLLTSEPDVQLGAAFTAQLYLDAKKADGLHPLVVTLAGTEQIDFWRAFADVVVVNCCGLGQDPARLASVLTQARSKLEPWQVLGALLPAGWGPGSPQPDAMRARLLAFSAVASGASVLGWYALRATGWDLRASPVWPSLRDLNQDLAKLSDATAGHPAAQDVAVAGEGILWRAWANADTRIVLLVNATGAAANATLTPQQGQITEPSSLVYEAKPVVTSEGLSVFLEAGAVAVIRARIGPSGPAGEPAPSSGQSGPAASETQPPPETMPQGAPTAPEERPKETL